METMNLKTTLKAYPKLSPSILNDYVTKDSLDTTLEDYTTKEFLGTTLDNYVEEAPVDNKPYARKDESWVPIKDEALFVAKTIFYGSNKELQLDNEAEILELQNKITLVAEEKSYVINYNQTEEGYLWIVCTDPISSITLGTMGVMADYEQQIAVIESDNSDAKYYCYRIRDMLIPNQWIFTVNF